MKLKQGAILAGLYGFKNDGRNMESTSRGPGSYSLTRAQNKFCGLRRRFSRALEEGQSAEDRDDVSRETILRCGQLTPVVPLLVVIPRSLRRRISARGEWVGLEAGRFFTDSTTALVRQNDKVRAGWDVRRPDENPHKKPFVSRETFDRKTALGPLSMRA